jgi:hypothetical protein
VKRPSLTTSVEDALNAEWTLLKFISTSDDPTVLGTMVEKIEDGGRTEDRVRHDYTGRYPLELLQNGHDACEYADRPGAIRIVVTDTALLVANEGVSFTPKRVRSLVRLGSSEKGEDHGRRATIGYKGVGFTSVFEITDRPQIFGAEIAFELNRERAERRVQDILGFRPEQVPARSYPFRITPDDAEGDQEHVEKLLGGGCATVIRLPYRVAGARDRVVSDVERSVRPEALLFLPALRELELTTPDGTITWTRSFGRATGRGRLVHVSASSGERQSWLVASGSIPVTAGTIAGLEDALWRKVRRLSHAVALPWRAGRPDDQAAPSHVHVYFPTDDALGRAVLVNGDFYIDSSRRHIETEGPAGDMNELLGAAVSKAAARLAESVADSGDRLLGSLAESDVPSGFGNRLGELLVEQLAKARIVRSANEGARHRRPADTKRLALASVKRERDLLPLLRPVTDLVRPGDDVGLAGDLLERLGSVRLSGAEIASRVAVSGNEIDYEAGLRTLIRWTTELDTADREKVTDALGGRPILRDTAGRPTMARGLALRGSDLPPLPKPFRREEVALPEGSQFGSFALVVGVEDMTPARAAEIVIGGLRSLDFSARPRVAREVHDFLRGVWPRWPKEVERLGNRLGAVPVPARGLRARRTVWRRADEVYFPHGWSGSREVESLYGSLGSEDFLAVPIPKSRGERRAAAAFYRALGVRHRPRVWRRSGKTDDWAWHRELKHFASWKSARGISEAFQCDIHTQSPFHVSTPVLDRLDLLMDSGHRETLAALARYLSSVEKPYGADAEVYCAAVSHYVPAKRKTPEGYQSWRLRTASWVPVRNDPTGAHSRPPTEAWTGSRLPQWLLVPQARLKAGSTRGLHLISAEAPGARAVEVALRDLERVFPDLENAPEPVARTADWLMRRADRGQQHADRVDPPPPFPAFNNGRLTWSANPVIVDLPDIPAALDVEALQAGHWRGLRRGYGLRRASEILNHDLGVGSRIARARLLGKGHRAQLAALLTSQGADENKVATRLARLEDKAVGYVQVRYGLDGGPLGLAVEKPYHLDLKRSRRGSVIGARLYWCPPISDAARIALGRELAYYLDLPPALHPSVSLFLTAPEAVLETEDVTSDDIAEAGRRVERHRRRGAEDEAEIFDLDDVTPPEAYEETGEDGESEGAAEVDRASEPPTGDSSSEPDADTEGSSLPELDHASVESHDIDRVESVIPPEPPSREGGSGGRTGGTGGRTDWARLEHERRLYGRRGEEVAYYDERRRLAGRGVDPDLVKWVSRENELSPYDLKSVDDDGGPRYIEVKSTTGDDPSDPFPISTPELRFAMRHRRRYWIYRVVDVKDASPTVWRYHEPIADLEAERGYLRMSKALLALPHPHSTSAT